ncbi:hypothetical protein [Alkalitalea saponilacus]|uniref:Capsule assembly protein Wzi n=1 Tax=Alkalitalea saponilacus TaxID=889453 RepID=A0A1T5HSN1_9BACT|nr:hypothetical protein [Alkalitalea saponilacus]ASB49215.1 hypothetical protein CDL62_08720 [Alkalitalea saponilacus]SKC23698.1 hypothetical protein SAMN03080601_02981 [Alkalitalea saponilacus]
MNFLLKTSIFVSVILIPNVISAQSEPWYYISENNLHEQKKNQIFLNFDSHHFLINNEFFGPIVEGYTLPGHIIQPTIVAYAGDHIRLEGGVNIRKYYGKNEELDFRAILSARLKFNDNLQLVMGTLNGHRHHSMLDALYLNERAVFNPVENGIQFLYDKGSTKADVWLNWEQFIRTGDTIPEIFTVGLNFRQKLVNNESGWDLTMPIQGIVMHEGGQISDFDTPSESLVNISAGLESRHALDGRISNIGWFGHYILYKDLREVNIHEIYSGQGIYAGVTAGTNESTLMLGYWDANNFIAPRGNPIYQSVSFIDPMEIVKNRQLVTAKYSWHRKFSRNVNFSFLVEAYYDLPISHFDYGYGIYLTFTPEFFISNFSF